MPPSRNGSRRCGRRRRNRSEEHTSELQSLRHLVCRLLLEKKKRQHIVPEFGAMAIGSVTHAHVQRFVKRLADRYAPATERVVAANLSSIFSETVRDGLVHE